MFQDSVHCVFVGVIYGKVELGLAALGDRSADQIIEL